MHWLSACWVCGSRLSLMIVNLCAQRIAFFYKDVDVIGMFLSNAAMGRKEHSEMFVIIVDWNVDNRYLILFHVKYSVCIIKLFFFYICYCYHFGHFFPQEVSSNIVSLVWVLWKCIKWSKVFMFICRGVHTLKFCKFLIIASNINRCFASHFLQIGTIGVNFPIIFCSRWSEWDEKMQDDSENAVKQKNIYNNLLNSSHFKKLLYIINILCGFTAWIITSMLKERDAYKSLTIFTGMKCHSLWLTPQLFKIVWIFLTNFSL